MSGGAIERVLSGEAVWPPPLWMMRQAGRYLPEYRALRATTSDFLSFCHDPEKAAEATLQPIRRFDFDAAIIFSDILVIPDALKRNVRFVEGEGPRLDPIEDAAVIEALPATVDQSRLAPTLEALRLVRKALPADKSLFGFCGAPWTVATYMIAGRGTPDQAPARLFAYRHAEAFAALLERLADVSIDYLCDQIEAGANVVQIFDSWAGVLPTREFERWCIEPVAKIVEGVRKRAPHARIIAFPRGATLANIAKAQALWKADGLSLDTVEDLHEARAALGPSVALQGNLDPLALMAGGDALERAIDAILAGGHGGAFIANLGHGILQHTPVAHVERLAERIRTA